MTQRKPIPGYENLYEVDTEGNVWRVGAPRARPLAAAIAKNGYARVVLSKNATHKNFSVHRLVLLAFTGPCPDDHEVRHLNGVPSDNRLENLAYGTKVENQQDRHAHGTAMFGETHPRAKLTEDQVREIRFHAKASVKTLASDFGVSVSTIEAIRSRRLWRHVA